MGLFNWFSKKKPDVTMEKVHGLIEKEVQDRLKLAIQRQDPDPGLIEEAVKERRRQPQPILFYSLPGRKNAPSRSMPDDRDSRGAEIGSPYDLAECIKLQDIESYFSTSVDRHVELIMKDGFYFEGKNPETIAYVQKRIEEIGMISGQAFEETVREYIRNVVVTANGYLTLKRDASRSSGRRIRLWGRDLDPVSAIYVPDPSSITCRQNKTGHVYQWIQSVEGEKKYWNHQDVIHVPVRKKSSFVFGTPYVIPVLEDIKALRKLEMLTEHVAHKFAFPLMHWKVGTEERPAEMVVDADTGIPLPEVVVAENIAKMMAQEGFACTSERHEIKFLGVEGQTLDLEPYVKHYEMRVLGGLRLSEIDLGRGDTANRGTAKVISQILADACREIQETVRTAINTKLLNILVLEGGFDLVPENRVFLNFPPIDKEEERAQETHGLLLYQSGGITLAEFRQEYLGRNPMSDEEVGDTFLENWLIPLAEATAEAKAAAKPATGSTKASAVTSVAMPTNQYGTGVKPKLPANDQILDIWNDCARNVRDAVEAGTDARTVMNQALQTIYKIIDDPISTAWDEGIKKALADTKVSTPDYVDKSPLLKYLNFVRTKDLQGLVRLCMINAGLNTNNGLPDGEGQLTVGAAFGATSPLLDSKYQRALEGARKLGYLEGIKHSKRDQIECVFEDDRTIQMNINEPGINHLASNPKVKEFRVVEGQA
jgi:hypothetical protein